MMKRLFFAALLMTGTIGAMAADYQYLTIEKTDGTALSLTAVGLNITYNGANLIASNGSETATFTLTEVSRMYFSNNKDVTAIADISSLQQDADAIVYDLHGRQLDQGLLSSLKTRLVKGVYLVKQHGKTVKIQVR